MRRAFVVGSSTFSDTTYRALPLASRDALSFHHLALDTSLINAPESILLLDPIRSQLFQAFGDFLSTLGENDFILYFAGHAARLANGSWVFICADTKHDELSLTGFLYRDLLSLLRQYERNRGLLILDTCFAGSASALRAKLNARSGIDSIIPELSREGLVTIWACGAEELSFEGEGHSLMSGWLLKAIRTGAGAGACGKNLTAHGVGAFRPWRGRRSQSRSRGAPSS